MRDLEMAGSINYADHRWISGWVSCKGLASSEPVSVEVLCDDQSISTLACTYPVDDRNCEAANGPARGFLYL